MARPRKPEFQDLPPNLIFDKFTGFYRYRNVLDGQYYQVSKDKGDAIQQAMLLNAELLPQMTPKSRRMITLRSAAPSPLTLREFIDERFLAQYLPERQLKETTLKDYRRRLAVMKAALGCWVISEITTQCLADFNRPKPLYQRKNYRSLFKLLFDYAPNDGLSGTNPALPLIIPKLKRQRVRLTLQHFNTIHDKAPQLGCKMPWHWDSSPYETRRLSTITVQRYP